MTGRTSRSATTDSTNVRLPSPSARSKVSIEQAIARRRTVRTFMNKLLSTEEIAQLCWAAQGITEPKEGLRAAPSAGAIYPIELFVVTAEHVARYRPEIHALETCLEKDVRKALQRASLDQDSVGQAPVSFIITATLERIEAKYGSRAEMYTLIEVGHVGQNMLLQAESLGLAGVPIGAFECGDVADILRLPDDHIVYYLLPIGHPRT